MMVRETKLAMSGLRGGALSKKRQSRSRLAGVLTASITGQASEVSTSQEMLAYLWWAVGK